MFFFFKCNKIFLNNKIGTASESTLLTLLTAKNKMINKIKTENPDMSDHLIQSKLVAYCSEHVTIDYYYYIK